MSEREATEHIGPGQPVTDANSQPIGEAKETPRFAETILPEDVEEKFIDGTLRDLSGLTAFERARVRDILDSEVTEEWWRKWRRTLAMLVRAIHIARGETWAQGDTVRRLERDLSAQVEEIFKLRQSLADMTAELAISRKEFAAEVQRNHALQQRLMESTESALETINNLANRLP